MRKTKLLALLVLVLIIMVILKCCGGKQEDTQVGTEVPDEQTQVAMAAQPDGKEVRLGKVSENEDGGVVITLTNEDGTEQTVTFTDVAIDSWYVDAVNYVISTNLMSGATDKPLFRPEYGTKRAEFAATLYNFGGGEPEAAQKSYPDLSGNEWFGDCVAWVTNHGYMNGKSDGTFDPEGFLSCEEALIILHRFAGEPKPEGTLENYPYAPKVSSYGQDAVTWAWNNGLITEKECVWYPTQTVSRAQVALLMMRYSALMNGT